jgi:hypothetical protein
MADGGSALSVVVTPSLVHLAEGSTVTFSATVTGASSLEVDWSVQEGVSGGIVSAVGFYTAPTTPGTYHVVAKSRAVPTATGTATVIVAAVGACTALPAPGTWDATSIAPVVAPPQPGYSWNGDSVAIVVDPYDSSTVWLGTGNRGLFRSKDCGATWKHVNEGMNGGALDQSVLWSMIVDPMNPGVIYADAAYGADGLWKSTNGGVDWTQLFPTSSPFATLVPYNFVNNVSMDPTNPMHLAVMSHGQCNDPYPLGCIAESFDGGATWPNIVSMPAAWGEKGGVQVVNATTWIWGGGDSNNGFYVTADNGKSWTNALPGGAGMGENSTQPLARASDGAYYVPSGQGPLRSVDGVAWSPAWGQQNFQTAGISALAFTSTTLYGVDNQNFFSSPLGPGAHWSSFPGPTGLPSNGYAGFIAYDQSHHLLYVSCWQGGLFRYSIP